jgi:hypothetical protein
MRNKQNGTKSCRSILVCITMCIFALILLQAGENNVSGVVPNKKIPPRRRRGRKFEKIRLSSISIEWIEGAKIYAALTSIIILNINPRQPSDNPYIL